MGFQVLDSAGKLKTSIVNAAMLNASNSFTLINPLITIAESWIGPSATAGIYFKNGSYGFGTITPALGGSYGTTLQLLDTANKIAIIAVKSTSTGTLGAAFFAQINDTGQELVFGTFGSGNTLGTLFGKTTAKQSYIFTQGDAGSTGLAIGTGDTNDLILGTNFTARVTIQTLRSLFSHPVNLKNYTVGTLPAGTRGDIAYVTDALAPAFLTALVGGGAVVTPAFYNGAAWIGF